MVLQPARCEKPQATLCALAVHHGCARKHLLKFRHGKSVRDKTKESPHFFLRQRNQGRGLVSHAARDINAVSAHLNPVAVEQVLDIRCVRIARHVSQAEPKSVRQLSSHINIGVVFRPARGLVYGRLNSGVGGRPARSNLQPHFAVA